MTELVTFGAGGVKTLIDAFKSLKNGLISGTLIPINEEAWNSSAYNIGNRGENYPGLIGLYENQNMRLFLYRTRSNVV